MSYEHELIEAGECPELVWIDTEDGPVTGRCGLPISDRVWLYRGYSDEVATPTTLPACDGHAEERVGWGVMSESERARWERIHDDF